MAKRAPAQPGFVRRERKRIERRSKVREIVFGSQDGIVTNLGILSSIAGARENNATIVLVGVASAIAGMISMASGQFLASKAEAEVQRSELSAERRKIQREPQREREELVTIYRSHGMTQQLARKAARQVLEDPDRMLAVMAYEELGVDFADAAEPARDAGTVALSFICGALVPLAPYFFLTGIWAFASSAAITIAVLFGIGHAKGNIAGTAPLKSGAESLFVGSAAAAVGYLVGTLLPRMFGAQGAGA